MLHPERTTAATAGTAATTKPLHKSRALRRQMPARDRLPDLGRGAERLLCSPEGKEPALPVLGKRRLHGGS